MSDIERLDWHTIISTKDDTPAEMIEALDAYFKPFAAQPGERGDDGTFTVAEGRPCFVCDAPMTGLVGLILGRGGFEWSIVHGEGHCRCCRWPARAYHYIKDANGEDLMTIRNLVLQYHPDEVDADLEEVRRRVREEA